MTMQAKIIDLSEALDPERQGEHWPDPISFDGRPLREQAIDLLVLADAHIADALLPEEVSEVQSAADVLRTAMEEES